MMNSPGKQTPLSRVVLLALVIRQVSLATIEPKSHLTLPPTWCASCRGVGTATSIVILVGVIVHVFGGSDGLRKTRIMERMQWFILVEAN